MKISETKNSNIDEGPLDLLTRSGRQQRKSFNQGKQVVKLTTENLMRQFAEYLGQKGLSKYTQASIADMKDFLSTKNVDTSDLDSFNDNRALTKQFVQKKFIEKSREAAVGRGAAVGPDYSPSPNAGPNANTGGRPGPTISRAPNAGSNANTGGSSAPKIPRGLTLKGSDGNNYVWRGAAWTVGNTNRLAKKAIGKELSDSAIDAISNLPDQIQSSIKSLTPIQKQVIKSML